MKKMYLVSEKMLEDLKAPPPQSAFDIFGDIHAEGAQSMFDKMSDVLKKKNVSNAQKMREYNTLLPQYLAFVKKTKESGEEEQIATAEEAPVSEPSNVADTDEIGDELLESVPKKFKSKAKIFLNKLRKDMNVRWDSKGTFYFKGQEVPNTHIIDLVHDALRERKTHEPHGWKVFAKALKEGNYSQDLVGNAKRWTWMYPEDLLQQPPMDAANGKTLLKPPKRLLKTAPRDLRVEAGANMTTLQDRHNMRLKKIKRNWLTY